MKEIIQAELACGDARDGLHDARFSRTMLLAIGSFVVLEGLYLAAVPACIFGMLTLLLGLYYQAYRVTKYEKALTNARVRMAQAIGSVGQYGQSTTNGCE